MYNQNPCSLAKELQKSIHFLKSTFTEFKMWCSANLRNCPRKVEMPSSSATGHVSTCRETRSSRRDARAHEYNDQLECYSTIRYYHISIKITGPRHKEEHNPMQRISWSLSPPHPLYLPRDSETRKKLGNPHLLQAFKLVGRKLGLATHCSVTVKCW